MTWTRHVFTSGDAATFTTKLNTEFDAIKAEMGAGGAFGAFGAWAGTGRLVQPSGDIVPLPPASPALAIRLPVGFTWIQDGQAYAISEDDGTKTIAGLPANYEGYLSLSVSVEDDEAVWEVDWDETRPVAGSGTLAYFETDADGVTELLASEAESDVVLSMPVLLTRLGGGGEGGATPYWGAMARSSTSVQTVPDFVEGEIAEATASLTALIAAGGARPRSTVVDALVLDNAINRDSTVALLPSDGTRHNAAFGVVTVDGMFGDGSGGYPTYFRTDLDVDEDGVITP